MLKKIILSLLLLNSSLSACCGCALVVASMNALTATIKSSVKAGDKMTAMLYDNTVGKNNRDSLKETERRLRELSNTLKIKELGAKCDNKIIFELKKSNNTQNIIKSIEIYSKSIEN